MGEYLVSIVAKFDVRKFVHCDTIMKVTNKMQLRVYRLIYYSKSALHVSGDAFAHHQEHLNVFTASDNIVKSLPVDSRQRLD